MSGVSEIKIPAYGGGQAKAGGHDSSTGGIASVSLKAMQSSVAQNLQQPHTPTTAATPSVEARMPVMDDRVTQEQVKHNWIRYARSVADEKPRLYSMMNNQIPELRNDTELWIKLKNQTQESEIQREKGGILKFLREELRNSRLNICVEMEKEDVPSNIAYTAADKFKLMLEKNPNLLILKQQFGLDIE